MAQEQSGAPLFYVAPDQPCALLLPDTEEYLQSVMAAGLHALSTASPPQPVPQPGRTTVRRIQYYCTSINDAKSGDCCFCCMVYQRERSSSEISEKSLWQASSPSAKRPQGFRPLLSGRLLPGKIP